MNKDDKRRLQALYRDASYNTEAKNDFHSAARTFLRRAKIKLASSGYGVSDPIRSNKGGIAVSGEVTLHFDRLYIQVSQSCLGSNNGVMFRSCEGRKDYSGGQNHFTNYEVLADTDAFVRLIQSRVPMHFPGLSASAS